jgi:hypothetical protein
MRIAELSTAERALWDAVPRGASVDLSTGRPEEDEPAMSGRWGPERVIRAEVIVALLLGAAETEPGQVAAVRLAGARITGTLNLDYAEVTVPLALSGCAFDEQPRFYWARMQSVQLRRCRLPGIVASGLRVDGHLWLEDSRVAGGISLDSARIAGILDLSGVQVANPGGEALLADRLVVDANVYCGRGFAADGEVRLAGARVGGQLIMRGARLGNESGHALYASRLTVAANMFCDEGFTAQGAVRLRGARVGGYLSLQGATLLNPGRTALNAGDLAVETDVYCSEGFRATGEVSFAGARIGGQLSMVGAHLHHRQDERALGCQRVQAAELDLRFAERVTGIVDLSYAKVGRLRDNPDTWPDRQQLDGFVYETLDPRLAAKRRLDWLRRDVDDYQPQAYEQLAASYRAIGQDAERRTVLLAKERDRRAKQSPPRKVAGLVQDVMVGYGYRPFRAAAWLFALLAIGTVVFYLEKPPLLPLDDGQHPQFNAFLYTLDLLLPVGSLGQEGLFAPKGVYLWISDLLVVAGFILGLTVAAGATRVLSRE